jgi:small nuclear ribonucleoprotein G
MGKGGPELASYMEKTLSLKMDAGRHIEGVLRGYDPFLNIVLDQVLQLFLHFPCVC